MLRSIAMRTKNAANYALLEDKIAELVEKRLEDIRQNEEIVYFFLAMYHIMCLLPCLIFF